MFGVSVGQSMAAAGNPQGMAARGSSEMSFPPSRLFCFAKAGGVLSHLSTGHAGAGRLLCSDVFGWLVSVSPPAAGLTPAARGRQLPRQPGFIRLDNYRGPNFLRDDRTSSMR